MRWGLKNLQICTTQPFPCVCSSTAAVCQAALLVNCQLNREPGHRQHLHHGCHRPTPCLFLLLY